MSPEQVGLKSQDHLARDRLLALGPEAAMAEFHQIKGIGPFYSSLIVIRGTGFTDVLPAAEPRALALAARLYDLPEPASAARFTELAEAWKPLRTWAVVLIRAAGPACSATTPPAPRAGPAGAGGQHPLSPSAGPASTRQHPLSPAVRRRASASSSRGRRGSPQFRQACPGRSR